MNKFNLNIVKVTEEDTTYQGGGDFLSSCRTWEEEWTVTDKNGRIVDKKIVDRMITTGMSGMSDHWTYCSACGVIFHEAWEEYCQDCRKW